MRKHYTGRPSPVAPASAAEEQAPLGKEEKLTRIDRLRSMAADGKVDLRPPLVDPGAPLWARLFAELHDLDDISDAAARNTAWAAIWLYLIDNPQRSTTAVQLPSGHFAISCLSLDLTLRDSLFTALNAAGLKGKMLAPYWQREKITSEHPLFDTVFELCRDADGKKLFRFRPEICARLEEVMQEDGTEGSA